MTATDVLRAMLDERGVEWTASGTDTCWTAQNGYPMRAWETTDRTHMRVADLTPTQIIEATLGPGTCHDKGNIELFICSECGCRLDLQDDDWEPTMWLEGAAMVPRYCPNCGRKVVE